jgi:predicted nucleic acid-binding protein
LADIVDPALEKDEALRDPAGQPVLGTLLASQADYLITGDKDSLAAQHPILTPAAFWDRHGG